MASLALAGCYSPDLNPRATQTSTEATDTAPSMVSDTSGATAVPGTAPSSSTEPPGSASADSDSTSSSTFTTGAAEEAPSTGQTSLTSLDSTGDTESAGAPPGCGDEIVTPGQMCFAPPAPFDSSHFFAAQAVDLDADGAQDLVMLDLDDAFVWRMGHGDGTFDPGQWSMTGEGAAALVVTATNDDEYPEIVVPVQLDSHFSVYTYDPDGQVMKTVDSYDTDFYPTGVAAGDLDGDGLNDLVVASGETDYAQFFLGTGDGFAPHSLAQLNGKADRAFVDDLDSDGHRDVMVFLSPSVGGYVELFRGDGAGKFEQTGLQFIAPDCPYTGRGSLADVTGDGVVDIVWTADVWLCMRAGDGAGGFGDASRHWTSFDEPARGFTVADLSSDGVADVAIVGDSDKMVVMERGADKFQLNVILDVTGDDVFSGDFNNDGVPDLLIQQGYTSAVIMLSDP